MMLHAENVSCVALGISGIVVSDLDQHKFKGLAIRC